MKNKMKNSIERVISLFNFPLFLRFFLIYFYFPGCIIDFIWKTQELNKKTIYPFKICFKLSLKLSRNNKTLCCFSKQPGPKQLKTTKSFLNFNFVDFIFQSYLNFPSSKITSKIKNMHLKLPQIV